MADQSHVGHSSAGSAMFARSSQQHIIMQHNVINCGRENGVKQRYLKIHKESWITSSSTKRSRPRCNTVPVLVGALKDRRVIILKFGQPKPFTHVVLCK